MASFNRVVLVGNVTRNPELRKVGAGTAVTDLSLAISEKYRGKNGEMAENTCYVDVVVWGRQAEACTQHVAKGSTVMIEGKLQLDQWQTDDGQKRSRLRVKADNVQFLGRPGVKADAPKASAPAQEMEPADF